MKRPRNLSIAMLAVVLLVGAVLVVVFGFGGEITGSAFRTGPTDSYDHVIHLPLIRSSAKPVCPLLECVTLNGDGSYTAFFSYESENARMTVIPIGPDNRFSPGPEDRGQPTEFESGHGPSWPAGGYSVAFDGGELAWILSGNSAVASDSSPPCVYHVHIEMRWYDAAGNLLDGPPADLPADFRITAESVLGTAVCAYPPESSDLACEYSNQAPARDSDGLWVPPGTSYAVAATSLPAGWRSFVGTGMFPGTGSAQHFTHVVDARATEASAPGSMP